MVKLKSSPPSLRLPPLFHGGVVATMRILVASNDSPFRRVASFLLGRRGFSVAEAGVSTMLELLGAHEHRVIVLDGEGSLDEAARLASLLEDFHPGLAVLVVVGDRDLSEDGGELTRPVFHKWDSFEALAEAIEDLRVPARSARSFS